MLPRGCWMESNTFLNQCPNSASNLPKQSPPGLLTRLLPPTGNPTPLSWYAAISRIPQKSVRIVLHHCKVKTYLQKLCVQQKCHKCEGEFQPNDTKHHCRACGEGFCDSCSSKTRPVPERGWGLAPVRVCDACFHNRGISTGKFFLMLSVAFERFSGYDS